MKAIALLLAVISCGSAATAQRATSQQVSGVAAVSAYHRKYNTTAHRALEMESAAQPIADSKYRLLDQLLDVMLARIPQQVRSSAANDPKAALLVLESVDKTLVEDNFVFPPQGLVDSFGDAMIPHNVDASVMAQIVNRPANQRRRPAIRDNDTHILRQDHSHFLLRNCGSSQAAYLPRGDPWRQLRQVVVWASRDQLGHK